MTVFVPGGDLEYQLDLILNQGVAFDDNMRGAYIEFETQEGVQELVHNLGFVPVGFLIIYKEADIDIWTAFPEEWTNERLSLRSSAPNVTVRMFVL